MRGHGRISGCLRSRLGGDTMSARPAESGHWYTTSGEPMYEVPKAKGDGTRKATLRDARKLHLVPGITSVIRELSAPAIERWKRGQTLMAALTTTRLEGETDEEMVRRIERDADEEAKQAAERGTAIHAQVQHWAETGEGTDTEPVRGVAAFLSGLAPHTAEAKAPWCSEVPFAHPMGYGSKADLFDRLGRWLIDVKTKEFDATNLPSETYESHWMQLAATREGLAMTSGAAYLQPRCVQEARCGILYLSRTDPEVFAFVEVSEEQLAKGWSLFCAALEVWSLRRGYCGAFDKEVHA